VSAQLGGGDHLGYIVAHRATGIAVEKASAVGIAVVGASDTWYTGMLSYYAEIAAARGLVSISRRKLRPGSPRTVRPKAGSVPIRSVSASRAPTNR
jgi:delta1-piperideine-2-carboxylate reductase